MMADRNIWKPPKKSRYRFIPMDFIASHQRVNLDRFLFKRNRIKERGPLCKITASWTHLYSFHSFSLHQKRVYEKVVLRRGENVHEVQY